MKNLTGIFDIGKTNKKFFLFDEQYQELEKTYVRFEEIKDLDGCPCDDLDAIEEWIITTLKGAINKYGEKIGAINFSTYGASFVHIDKDGNRLLPLINYLKEYPDDLLHSFYAKYGNPEIISKETASPQLGMLNSGMQLYWFKHTYPELFKKVKYSIHFPQYLSYLLTGIAVSDYTSIGCHTGLWDFEKQDYHSWIYDEGLDNILPPVVTTDTSINAFCMDQKIKIGVGIHDSSSALAPYLRVDKKPFLLISTGTWSIALNPFNRELLTQEDLDNDSLNFMRIDGQPVKASRLFLGNEYSLQVKKLQEYFNESSDVHKHIKFQETLYNMLSINDKNLFHLESLNIEREQPDETDYSLFPNFETAYHQLFIELVKIQVEVIYRAIGNTEIKKIYIDGGFTDNDLYVRMLSIHFPQIKIRVTKSPLGSALGAAMVLSDQKIKKKFLKKNFAMRKIENYQEAATL